jgi:hypothetical protein
VTTLLTLENTMTYFFAVLEDILGLREEPGARPAN